MSNWKGSNDLLLRLYTHGNIIVCLQFDVIYSHTNVVGGGFLNSIDVIYSHTNGSAVAKICIPLCSASYDYFLCYQAYEKMNVQIMKQ